MKSAKMMYELSDILQARLTTDRFKSTMVGAEVMLCNASVPVSIEYTTLMSDSEVGAVVGRLGGDLWVYATVLRSGKGASGVRRVLVFFDGNGLKVEDLKKPLLADTYEVVRSRKKARFEFDEQEVMWVRKE